MLTAVPVILARWLDLHAAWYLVGAALAAATILLVSLLRTRWRHAKPWKKCAALSAWVHVLLAYLTTLVHIVSGSPGYGSGYGPGPPIEVELVAAEIVPLAAPADALDEEASDAALTSDIASTEPDDEAGVDDQVEESDDPVASAAPETTTPPEAEPAAEPLAAPSLLEEPAAPEAPPVAAAESEVSPDDSPLLVPPPESPPTDSTTAEAPAPESSAAQPWAEPVAMPATTAVDPSIATATAAVSSAAAAPPSDSPPGEPSTPSARAAAAAAPPAPYARRFAADRAAVVAGGGGDANTERAVAAALAWLARAQSSDGRWDASQYGAGKERYPYVLGQDRGGAGAQADTGMTGLALLAFLGAGHSHQIGDYKTHVARGLDFLRRSQEPNGNLAGQAELFARMYCHSMATFAAGEAYALTRDARLEPLVRAAARYSLAVQHPTDGGWRYRPGDTGDTSQLGWQVMALKSAELGGLDVPAVTWTRVDRFLRQVERGEAGGLAAYRPEGPPTRSMTAEALYCRQLVAGQADGELSPAALSEALASLSKEPPSARPVNLYYWYYATLALNRAQHASPEAQAAWRRWNDALTRTLLASQLEDGSWPDDCIWAGYGGRVFTTSLAAMCLEVYYRYAPPEDGAAEEHDLARRRGWQSVVPR